MKKVFVLLVIIGLVGCSGQTNIKKDTPEGILLKMATRNVSKYVSLNNPEIVPEGKTVATAILETDDVDAAAAMARIGLGYLSDKTKNVSKADIRDGIALIIAVIGGRLDPQALQGLEGVDRDQLLEALHIASEGALEGFTEAEQIIGGA